MSAALPVAAAAAVAPFSSPDVGIFTLFFLCVIALTGSYDNEQLLLSASALSNQHLPCVFLHVHAVHANRNAPMQGIMEVSEEPQSFLNSIYF